MARICSLPAARRPATLARHNMLLPVFNDLVKPQWRTVIEALKQSGGLPVTDLMKHTGGSYMAVKTHCEELTAAGYLVRTRLPRAEVGRPEILYSLAAKADALFPQPGTDFILGLLDETKRMFGDTAPEKILYQHFQNRFEQLAAVLDRIEDPRRKLEKLAALRIAEGYASTVETDPLRLVEYHHPLARVFGRYPRAAAMEQRMIEQLLGQRVIRRELPGGREGTPRFVIEFS
jgi:predicted ArsR family transcriptional regulator